MQKFFDNVFDRNGSVIAGAVVTVSDAATGALSTIYSNNSLGIKANPITCDSNGYFEFYAANGRYTLTVTGGALTTRVVQDVLLEDITGTGASLVGFSHSDTNPAGSLGAKAHQVISIKDAPFNALMNGSSDDTAAAIAFLAYCETNGLAGTIPAGTLNLATWTTRNSTFVVLRGAGIGVTKIIGPKVVGSHFVQMMSGVADLEGIEFQKFDQVVYSEAVVDVVRIHCCKSKWNRSNLYRQADVDVFPASAVSLAMLTENEVDRSGGFHVAGAVTQAVAMGNAMVNVKRDATVWTADLALFQTFGISFGTTNNVASSTAQALVQNITVTGNSIAGMFNDTTAGTFNSTKAIQATGINVTITGNAISGVDATDRGGVSAIYCKAQTYVVANNTITAIRTTESCIAVKGTLTSSGPMEKNCIVSQNAISSSDGLCTNAVTMFGGGYCDIVGNAIDGMATDSIKVFGDPYRVNVLNNALSNNSGASVITFPTGSVSACRIEGNTIDGVLATTGALSPIRVVSNPRQVSTITVTAGGSGYTSVPTVAISGGGGGVASAQATIVGGVVIAIQVNSSDAGFTSVPAVAITGGGGSGATATAVLSTGTVNDLTISSNVVRWSPRSTHSSTFGLFVEADSTVAASSGNVVMKNNQLLADSSSTATAIRGANLFSATAAWFRDALIEGLHMQVPDITKCFPVNFNSTSNLPGQAANYTDLTVNNVTVNGKRQRILTKFQLDDTRCTAVVPLTGKAVGSNLLGTIPYSVLATHALVFTSSAPTSGTSTGTIGLSLGSAGALNLLGATLVTAFAANGFKAGIPDGTAANAKRANTSAGLVSVFLEVGVEALTGGQLELVLQTEAQQ